MKAVMLSVLVISTSNSVCVCVSSEGITNGCILRFFCGLAPN